MGRRAGSKNWSHHDDRLLRSLVSRGDLSAKEIYERYNKSADVKRNPVALGSRIASCRYVISDHHGMDVPSYGKSFAELEESIMNKLREEIRGLVDEQEALFDKFGDTIEV